MPPQEAGTYSETLLLNNKQLPPQEAGITELLMSPAKIPGCSGTRNLADNLSDLKAQVGPFQ